MMNKLCLFYVVGCVAAAIALCAAAESAPGDVAADSDVSIVFDRAAGRFEVRGLTAKQLRALEQRDQDEKWVELFVVFAGSPKSPARPAMLGEYSVNGGVLRFMPRFPLVRGLTYVAVFHPDVLAVSPRENSKPVTRDFLIPADPPAEPAAVVQVYPTRDVLPENQLKFYLHFSTPMSQGDAYRYIHLLSADGTEVEFPFLELGEELWNETGTRLTVFFDPGRIKRGLKPREDVGPTLEEGKSYTLAIDREWPDAAGRPLAAAFRKKLKAGPPDDVQPDPARWTIESPKAGTRDPLVVGFDEPLDHAMLHRVLSVHRGKATAVVAGRIEIDRSETRWQFRPEQPWSADAYRLEVQTVLEDLAGNSIGRPFEVDVFRPVERAIPQERVAVPFAVR
jgi:hypothetical protein